MLPFCCLVVSLASDTRWHDSRSGDEFFFCGLLFDCDKIICTLILVVMLLLFGLDLLGLYNIGILGLVRI